MRSKNGQMLFYCTIIVGDADFLSRFVAKLIVPAKYKFCFIRIPTIGAWFFIALLPCVILFVLLHFANVTHFQFVAQFICTNLNYFDDLLLMCLL